MAVNRGLANLMQGPGVADTVVLFMRHPIIIITDHNVCLTDVDEPACAIGQP